MTSQQVLESAPVAGSPVGAPTAAGRVPMSRTARALAVLIAFGLIAIVVREFGPQSIGGPNDYLVTNGISMLPTIEPHSMVVVRAENSYSVGDVVAYHNAELKTVVLHRIVRRDGSRFVLKGDNNQFPDIYEPAQSDILGKEVLYSPSFGRVLTNLRVPWVGATFLGLVVLWMLWGVGSGEGDGRRSPRHRASRPTR